MLEQISDLNFKEKVLDSKIPVLVDMYADWCGPCKAIAPVLEKLQEDYGDKLKIVKVNIEQHPEFSTTYKIQAIPYLIIFKDGIEVDRIIGVGSTEKFKAALDKLV
jgi:thioredoxin 1